MLTIGDIISIFIGLGGIVLTVYIYYRSKRQIEIYKERSSIRYKDVSKLVSNLTEHIINSCEVVNSECIGHSPQCNRLVANISSAMALSRELIRFCERLDEEYKSEFHHTIDKKVAEHLKDIDCRCVDIPKFDQLQKIHDFVLDKAIRPNNP